MKVKLFEEYNNLVNLTKEQENVIENITKTWYSNKTINEKGEITAQSIGENHKLEDMCKYYKRRNTNTNKNVYIIIENKTRILSEEEINIITQSKKYNL